MYRVSIPHTADRPICKYYRFTLFKCLSPNSRTYHHSGRVGPERLFRILDHVTSRVNLRFQNHVRVDIFRVLVVLIPGLQPIIYRIIDCGWRVMECQNYIYLYIRLGMLIVRRKYSKSTNGVIGKPFLQSIRRFAGFLGTVFDRLKNVYKCLQYYRRYFSFKKKFGVPGKNANHYDEKSTKSSAGSRNIYKSCSSPAKQL